MPNNTTIKNKTNSKASTNAKASTNTKASTNSKNDNTHVDEKKYSTYELKKIVNDISDLSNNEKKEIFKILDKNDIKYTENSNGIYIIISQIPSSILDQILEFLDFCQKNRESLSKVESLQTNEKQNIYGSNEDMEEEEIYHQSNMQMDNKYTAKLTHQNELDKYGLNLEDEEDVDINITKNKPKYSGIKAKIIKSTNSKVKNTVSGNTSQSNGASDPNQETE